MVIVIVVFHLISCALMFIIVSITGTTARVTIAIIRMVAMVYAVVIAFSAV